jgi:8-oxo-dGTP pyrophosphatase MutT (NUDIX family)
MSSEYIRPLAICVFRHRGRILVNEAHDPVKSETFCRPLGGGIEFGETSAQAVVREVREEIAAEITNLQLIGTLENIFTYLGAPGHEIVQVYDAEFIDRSLYEKASIAGAESDGQPFQAIWRKLEEFSKDLPLYPEGLCQLLQSVQLHDETDA